MELSVPLLGKVAIEPAVDGRWGFKLDYQGRAVALDYNVEGEMLTQGAVDSVARFVSGIAEHDGIARAAISGDYNRGGEYTARLYVDHHLEQFDAATLQECFGTGDRHAVSSEMFLSKLYLHRVVLYPDDDFESAVFDYTVSTELTDYVIAARFDRQGEVMAVEMES